MRRGGRTIYAFDVSTIDTDPTSPTLKWRNGCPNLADDTGCTAGFEEIGQTWSAPKVLKATGYIGAPARRRPADVDRGRRLRHLRRRRPEHLQPRSTPRATGSTCSTPTPAQWLTEFTTDRGVVADVFVITDDATRPGQVGLRGRPGWQHLSHLRRRCQYANSRTTRPGELDDDQDRLARLRHGVDSLRCATASS